jgi:hypothetical protein
MLSGEATNTNSIAFGLLIIVSLKIKLFCLLTPTQQLFSYIMEMVKTPLTISMM